MLLHVGLLVKALAAESALERTHVRVDQQVSGQRGVALELLAAQFALVVSSRRLGNTVRRRAAVGSGGRQKLQTAFASAADGQRGRVVAQTVGHGGKLRAAGEPVRQQGFIEKKWRLANGQIRLSRLVGQQVANQEISRVHFGRVAASCRAHAFMPAKRALSDGAF